MMKMEEHVRELETQLKDMYKGQIGNNQEVVKYVKENKELSDRLRDTEKRAGMYGERVRECEELMRRMTEEVDTKEELVRNFSNENDSLRQTNKFLEQKVREVTADN